MVCSIFVLYLTQGNHNTFWLAQILELLQNFALASLMNKTNS